tara:strand:- start:133 stop:234 length:102 start_codon:yes stop_codon:yes gene_type:complete
MIGLFLITVFFGYVAWDIRAQVKIRNKKLGVSK